MNRLCIFKSTFNEFYRVGRYLTVSFHLKQEYGYEFDENTEHEDFFIPV